MKLREYEAKNVIKEAGIPVPAGFLIRSADELPAHLGALGDAFVLKAQVDVGGRGKAGGILMADKKTAVAGGRNSSERDQGPAREGDPCRAADSISSTSIISRSPLTGRASSRSSSSPKPAGWRSRSPQRKTPELIRKVIANPLMRDLPPFMIRELIGTAPKEIGPSSTSSTGSSSRRMPSSPRSTRWSPHRTGSLPRMRRSSWTTMRSAGRGFTVNRDLSEREREAEKHGFSYVELDGRSASSATVPGSRWQPSTSSSSMAGRRQTSSMSVAVPRASG